uniref:Tc1-like transposase DDE domain-containing protein n=1 Tax=Cyprinus carpio TaxID=7962 RepID=A0A8C1Z2X1_CYPCA
MCCVAFASSVQYNPYQNPPAFLFVLLPFSSWFQTNKINVMEWPAQSPDLNPIENLWGDIKNAVSEAKPRNVNELWNVVKESWSGITAERCHKLVDSMPHRCQAVLKNCGHTTKY